MVEVQRGYYKKSCSKDSLRALQDSKVQYKYYMNVAAPYGTEFLPHKELEAILKRNNIEWGGFWMGSDIGGYNEDCYFSYMSKLTENKYGKDFIDHLIKQSVEEYVRKNPNKIFEGEDQLDWTFNGSIIENYSQKDELHKSFYEYLKYPKGYQFKKENYSSYSYATLLLDKTGKILEIQRVKHTFYNPKNQKFQKYFENQLIKFLKRTKLEPVKYAGYPVKSKVVFMVNYN